VGYIIAVVFGITLFLGLHYFTELTKNQKISIFIAVLAVVFSAVAYNNYNSMKTKTMMDAVLRFNQNKTIKCDGIDVNNTNFTLSVGTYTFIGKKNTPNYEKMVSASQCK